MEKNQQTRLNIPKLLNTFEIKNKFGELQWYLITMNTNFLANNPTFKENFMKVKNLKNKDIYFAGKMIKNIKYNIIYIGIMNFVNKNTTNLQNLIFFITAESSNLKIRNLTRKFILVFNKIVGLKLLKRDNDEYSLKSYTFKNQNFTDKKPFKKKLFLYFKKNINFSFEIIDELKTKFDENIIGFVFWNSDMEKTKYIELYQYLNNIKGILDKTKSKPEKWYIKFILLFGTLGADYYLKNKRYMFKNIPKYKIDNSKRINNARVECLKKKSFEALTKKTFGENIKIFFSNEILIKNENNTHIFIDGSSIDKTYNCIIVMTLKNNSYNCLFFIKYKKNEEIVEIHKKKCSRKKTKTKSDLCMCEWLFFLDFVLSKLKSIVSISIDFEPGLISATKKRNIKIFGCYFHYSQNLHNKTQKSKITKILVSICEILPFINFKARNICIEELSKIIEGARYTNKNINEFNDYKIIEYLKNFVYSKSIDKFNYILKIEEDYLKLTNNCCERFFNYLKNEAMSAGCTFEESILVRIHLDFVSFFETGNSTLKNKYDCAEIKLELLVKKYKNKINKNSFFAVSEKKSKNDKNFKSKKTKISDAKQNIVIESEFELEFEENNINQKKIAKSMEFIQNVAGNKKNYSETYKSGCINYIGKVLVSNRKTDYPLKKTMEIEEKDKIIETQHQLIIEKDNWLYQKDEVIKKKDSIIEEKDKVIGQRDAKLEYSQLRIIELETTLKKLKKE